MVVVGDNAWYQSTTTTWKEVGKALHLTASVAFRRFMFVDKWLQWSFGSVVSLYSLLGILTLGGISWPWISRDKGFGSELCFAGYFPLCNYSTTNSKAWIFTNFRVKVFSVCLVAVSKARILFDFTPQSSFSLLGNGFLYLIVALVEGSLLTAIVSFAFCGVCGLRLTDSL